VSHHLMQKDREQTGLPPGQVREVLPIAPLHVSHPAFGVYVRVHRRHGTRERVLDASEIQVGWWQGRVDWFQSSVTPRYLSAQCPQYVIR
jgi:hypothetical protein